MKPMNLQEEVKKLEEHESGINVACPMEDEASWVITCKGDHEEEITQFDGETVKMMINEISKLLIVEQNVVVPVLLIRKEIGEVTKLIPEECISECVAEEITDVLVSRRRTRDRWKEAGIHNEGRVRSG